MKSTRDAKKEGRRGWKQRIEGRKRGRDIKH